MADSEAKAGGLRFLLGSLALQNLGRRKARSLLLFAAVAICAGSVFTGAVLMLSIERSMEWASPAWARTCSSCPRER